jgi:hypothetical protein
MQTLSLVVLILFACGKPTTDHPPAPPEVAPIADAFTCASADDCALSNLRSETDCCGDPCNAGEAYHETQLAKMQAARTAYCANKAEECPVADCDLPINFVPGCDHGKCVAIELPRRTECDKDADCVLSCEQAGDCCASCDCATPWHRDDLARADQWRTEQCAAADCPMKKCAAPAETAHCDKGWCVAR